MVVQISILCWLRLVLHSGWFHSDKDAPNFLRKCGFRVLRLWQQYALLLRSHEAC